MVSKRLSFSMLIVVAICLLPLLAGVLATIIPALGYYPALGHHNIHLAQWAKLFSEPGLLFSLTLSLKIGIVSTLLAVALTFTLLSLLWQQRGWRIVSLYLAPALALPHVAFAIGLSFVLAPSGWFIRLLMPLLDGSEPPLWMTINDPWGWSLIVMLIIKEVPFLLLMALGVLSQLEPERQLLMARSLGYDRIQAWWKVLVPQIYTKLRLPIAAVLVYGITVVDAAMIIGPQLPPPMAIRVFQWFQHSDLDHRLLACCGAILLTLSTLLVLGLWRMAERALLPLSKRVWLNARKRVHHPAVMLGAFALPVLALLSVMTLIALIIWSLTQHWHFPRLMPATLSLQAWYHASNALKGPMFTALTLALSATLLATVATIIVLEYQQQRDRYWPMVIPCCALFIPGITLFTGLPMLLNQITHHLPFIAVVWGHLLMAFPYVYLSLHGPYKAIDGRYITVARSLGASSFTVWWKIKRPLLQSAILSALAIGFSVSIVQYLPTLLMSGGRLATVTTEAVAITASYDRTSAAIYGLSQAAMPLTVFWLIKLWKPKHLRKRYQSS
ncbi:ABC transporter permease [Thaumasiovibrio sp. DFM-14]|uniref:ABC transporter permease n=1 Tax=Thaumasiovibrio sp. DFM-14 TaxID=3384792 RepID=UPI0039A2B0D4